MIETSDYELGTDRIIYKSRARRNLWSTSSLATIFAVLSRIKGFVSFCKFNSNGKISPRALSPQNANQLPSSTDIFSPELWYPSETHSGDLSYPLCPWMSMDVEGLRSIRHKAGKAVTA
jgi:tellurite resistance-related uncharacterized protein